MAELGIWEKAVKDRTLLTLILELTARCNNNCTHCYINLPESDKAARQSELTFSQVAGIVDQAVEMGALWGVLSGGEPLLRPDFPDIYIYKKKKGLLVSLFTNAVLITREHVELFKQYPPRDIEITIYGVSPETHRKLTSKNTFESTMAGIKLLAENNIQFSLKTVATRSTKEEIDQIKTFCESTTKQPFRFDPVLQLRLDKDPVRNRDISSERLRPDEIIDLEKNNPPNVQTVSKNCSVPDTVENTQKLFKCRAGQNSCVIDYAGNLKLCTSLVHPETLYDLKTGSLQHAWYDFAPAIMNMTAQTSQFKSSCGTCSLHNICSWCPAHADLETNNMEGQTPYFCSIANKRSATYKCAN